MRGNATGWTSLEVVAALMAGFLLAIASVNRELRAGEPMVSMRFFRHRAFSSGIGTSFFLFASLYGALFFMAQFMPTPLGCGPLGPGLRLLPWTATLFVVAPVAGGLVNRIGERRLIVAGFTLQAVVMAWIGLIVAPHLAYAKALRSATPVTAGDRSA
jgi:predicted MFS family arabinose efflux permease